MKQLCSISIALFAFASSASVAYAQRGTCASDADCAMGYTCGSIPNDPDGWNTCFSPPASEATTCTGQVDQCCMSSDCTTGQNGGCFLGPLWYCGGAPPIPHNICVYDGCQSNADCTNGSDVCVRQGGFGEQRSRCVGLDCRYDFDCTLRSGGACMPFFDPCNRRFIGFGCTYDASACRSDADCGGGFNYCAPGTNRDGMTSCRQFIPPP